MRTDKSMDRTERIEPTLHGVPASKWPWSEWLVFVAGETDDWDVILALGPEPTSVEVQPLLNRTAPSAIVSMRRLSIANCEPGQTRWEAWRESIRRQAKINERAAMATCVAMGQRMTLIANPTDANRTV